MNELIDIGHSKDPKDNALTEELFQLLEAAAFTRVRSGILNWQIRYS